MQDKVEFKEKMTEDDRIIKVFPDGYKILELGCGPGWLLEIFSRLGGAITGLDISPESINIAKKKNQAFNNIEYVVADALDWNPTELYNCVISFDSIHHILDEKSILAATAKWLKPGGLLILVEPGEAHGRKESTIQYSKKYGTIERGFSDKSLIKILKNIGLKNITSYFAPPYEPPIKRTYLHILKKTLGLVYWYLKGNYKYKRKGIGQTFIVAEK